jgi:hypothetical protein
MAESDKGWPIERRDFIEHPDDVRVRRNLALELRDSGVMAAAEGFAAYRAQELMLNRLQGLRRELERWSQDRSIDLDDPRTLLIDLVTKVDDLISDAGGYEKGTFG